MIYKDFQNLRLPMLGFGSMRLPLLPGGGDGDVDEAAVAEMVALAMERGANYFDTAYGYHNGNSERVMGRVLSRYPRESWLLASKFPGYDVSNIRPDRVEAIFEEQLEKCGVDYFDFYLFHNVYERNVGPYLDPDNRVLEYLLRQKEAGRIRHLGFSAHGSLAVIQRFLDAYGEYMEFGQLQLNYLDWDFQGARAKAEELNRRHIPIWVMEPLRGGRLARLSDGDAARLAALRPEESVPGWAFRFLQGVPGVTMVLSGMSRLEQLRANLDTFETDRPLSEAKRPPCWTWPPAWCGSRCFPAPPAATAWTTAPGTWTSPACWPSTTSTPSPAAASSPPWRWKPCRRRSGPPPASAAGAARQCAPSSSKSPKLWPTSPASWGKSPGRALQSTAVWGIIKAQTMIRHKEAPFYARWIHQGGRRHAPDPGGRLPLQRRTDFHPHAGGR